MGSAAQSGRCVNDAADVRSNRLLPSMRTCCALVLLLAMACAELETLTAADFESKDLSGVWCVWQGAWSC